MIWLASWPLWKWNFFLRTFVIRYEDCKILCGLIDDESDSDRKTIYFALTNMNSFSSEDSYTSPWSMKLILLVKSIKDTYIFFFTCLAPNSCLSSATPLKLLNLYQHSPEISPSARPSPTSCAARAFEETSLVSASLDTTRVNQNNLLQTGKGKEKNNTKSQGISSWKESY